MYHGTAGEKPLVLTIIDRNDVCHLYGFTMTTQSIPLLKEGVHCTTEPIYSTSKHMQRLNMYACMYSMFMGHFRKGHIGTS